MYGACGRLIITASVPAVARVEPRQGRVVKREDGPPLPLALAAPDHDEERATHASPWALASCPRRQPRRPGTKPTATHWYPSGMMARREQRGPAMRRRHAWAARHRDHRHRDHRPSAWQDDITPRPTPTSTSRAAPLRPSRRTTRAFPPSAIHFA